MEFSTFSFEAAKIVNIRLFLGNRRPTTAVNCHHLSDILVGGPLIKSFAGLVPNLVLYWSSACFVGVDSEFLQRLTQIIDPDSDRQEMETTTLNGYRIAPIYIPN